MDEIHIDIKGNSLHGWDRRESERERERERKTTRERERGKEREAKREAERERQIDRELLISNVPILLRNLILRVQTFLYGAWVFIP